MNDNSAKGTQFGFSNPKAEKGEQDVDNKNTSTGEETIAKSADTADAVAENVTDEEYTDVRKVTIMLVKNYSLYRKANDKVLPKRKDYIGSSIHASRILSANKEEVDTYFPNIIGLSPSDPNFIMRVKQYLNNIRISVDELGRTFNVSFHYYHKSDYFKIKAEEDKIENAYQLANRQTF